MPVVVVVVAIVAGGAVEVQGNVVQCVALSDADLCAVFEVDVGEVSADDGLALAVVGVAFDVQVAVAGVIGVVAVACDVVLDDDGPREGVPVAVAEESCAVDLDLEFAVVAQQDGGVGSPDGLQFVGVAGGGLVVAVPELELGAAAFRVGEVDDAEARIGPQAVMHVGALGDRQFVVVQLEAGDHVEAVVAVAVVAVHVVGDDDGVQAECAIDPHAVACVQCDDGVGIA